ncbi:MAG: TetR/AcrR family transcriptional regulator [Candidatus Kapabacteria bacterium]|nr:TetR/AcrR family transcriptional regulator [Candidatus Kapabacteria bacterium]
MPRTKKQFLEMQEASKAEILQAALELFSTKGFEQTSVSAIAQKAGISQGLMYNYFPSKEALLLAIFEKGWAEVQRSFVIEPRKGRKKPSLYDFIENACRLTVAHQEFWRFVNVLRSQPTILAELGDKVSAFEAMILAQIEQFCGAPSFDVSSHEARSKAASKAKVRAEARLIFALIDGICHHALQNPQTYPLNDVLRLLKPQYDSRFLQ